MAFRPRVFLDTAAVKHSIRSRFVYSPRRHTLKLGGNSHEVTVHDIIEIDPTSKVEDERLRGEINLLSEVARRAKTDEIELLWNVESEFEFFTIYGYPGGGSSELLDAGVTMVDAPIKYSRLLSSSPLRPGETWKSMRTDFLTGLDYPRYRQLQRACGVLQGDHINENQLSVTKIRGRR